MAHQVQDKVYREAAPELWVAASASLSVLWVREVILLVCLRRQDLQNAFKGKKLHHRSWLDQVRRRPIPLPPGYTRNAFNWFNLAMLIVVGQTLWGRTPSSRNLVALGVFLVWVRLLSLLKDTSQMFSTFVLMTLQVAQSLGTFVTLLFIFLMGFGQVSFSPKDFLRLKVYYCPGLLHHLHESHSEFGLCYQLNIKRNSIFIG